MSIWNSSLKEENKFLKQDNNFLREENKRIMRDVAVLRGDQQMLQFKIMQLYKEIRNIDL